MKRHAVIVALRADHGDLQIARFFGVARSFVHITPNIWPPRSLHRLDYYVWNIVEKEVNKHPHITKDSLKGAIVRVMSDRDQLIRARQRGRVVKAPCL